MAVYMHEVEKDSQEECPVCYEFLSETETRSLSCGHAFCHDCLVKTLVSVTRDGIIKDTIICPICRHLTFIQKQKEVAVVSLVTEKDADDGQQTLEVPITSLPLGDHRGHLHHQRLEDAQLRASTNGGAAGASHWIVRVFRRISERVNRGRLVGPCSRKACQIFIISDRGRPMVEEDALSVVNMTAAVVQPQHHRRRRRICTTARCLVVLLSAFTFLALVAATLPWILLA